MLRYIRLFLLMVLAATTAQAQQEDTNVDKIGGGLGRGPKAASLENRAVKSMRGLDYFAAMKYYGLAIASDSSNLKAYDGYGDAATAVYLLAEAEKAYGRLAYQDSVMVNPAMLLRLAAIKMLKGAYPEAEMLFGRAAAAAGADIRAEAQKGLEDARWIQSQPEPPQQVFALEPLSSGLNDLYFSEYALEVLGDTLYYASFSFPFEKDKHIPKRELIKVLSAVQEGDTMRATVEGFNEAELHTAHATFSPDGNTLYYTICKYVGDADIRCDLYSRQRTGLSWGPAAKLPEPVNAEGYSTTQPRIAVLPDGKTQMLYFVSNRPGSKGMDIWAASVSVEGIGTPERLGDVVNTPGDEFTPFYDHKNGHLYFSSDGHRGFGGQDVFRATGRGARFETPQNLGSTINSNFNEICFIKTADSHTAYFASNRGGNIFSKDTICCYDLYKACLTQPSVIVRSFNSESAAPISNASVKLWSVDAQGRQTEIQPVADESGLPAFHLQSGTTYHVYVDAPYCVGVRDTFETPVYFCDRLERDYKLKPVKVSVELRILSREDSTAVFYTNGQLRTLLAGGGGEQKEWSVDTLEASNLYVYSLQFGRRYNFIVSKRGFTSDQTAFDTHINENIERDTVLLRNLYISRGVYLIVEVFHEITEAPLDSVTFCFVEVIRGGKDVYKSASNWTGNTYTDYVEYGKRYHVYASRPAYKRGPDFGDREFQIPPYTEKAYDTLRISLLLRPARPEAYFPIKLYFDNDQPVPRSFVTTTTVPYNETYEAYTPRRANFVEAHIKDMPPADTTAAASRVRGFFKDSVEIEYKKLLVFTEELTYSLIYAKDTATIILKGYASPLGPKKASGMPDYNFNLTERRIVCVDNHFRRFPGLNQLREGNTPQLRVGREPNGAALAPANVSANPKDRRFSVFSAEASHERRVEVVGAVITPRIPVPEEPQLTPCEEN